MRPFCVLAAIPHIMLWAASPHLHEITFLPMHIISIIIKLCMSVPQNDIITNLSENAAQYWSAATLAAKPVYPMEFEGQLD